MAIEPPLRLVITDKPQFFLRGEEYRASRTVHRTANFLRKVASTDDPLFIASPKPGLSMRVRPTYNGDRLLDAVSKRLPEFEEYFPGNACNPYIELLRCAVLANPGIEYAIHEVNVAKGGKEAEELFRLVSGFVEWLREAARSDEFLAELDARRRQCEKNTASAKKYIDEIFRYRASKNLAVRLDLVCGAENPERRGITSTVTVEEAREELERWLRHVREKYPLTGYLGTFEYGALTGYHFHVLLFFDGHKQWDGQALGFLLGEVWRNQITEGRGRYFNCNAVDYAENGIGMIWHYDHEKRAVLMDKVVGYLTKTDFWLKFQGTRKTFFRGRMPAESEKAAVVAGIGRPRKGIDGDGEAEVT